MRPNDITNQGADVSHIVKNNNEPLPAHSFREYVFTS